MNAVVKTSSVCSWTCGNANLTSGEKRVSFFVMNTQSVKTRIQPVFIAVFLCGWAIGSQEVSAMRFEIKTTWDNQPIDHAPATIELLPHDDNSFQLIVEGKFFGDPNPGGEAGQPFFGLWNHEVIELFLANGDNQYVEIELGPWGQHIVLLLNGVHKAVKHSLPLEYTVLERTDNGQWQGRAIIPADYLPPNVTKINAYAIHGTDPQRVYESLYPVPTGKFENADFHRLEFFRPVDISELLPQPVTSLSSTWQRAITEAS